MFSLTMVSSALDLSSMNTAEKPRRQGGDEWGELGHTLTEMDYSIYPRVTKNELLPSFPSQQACQDNVPNNIRANSKKPGPAQVGAIYEARKYQKDFKLSKYSLIQHPKIFLKKVSQCRKN